MMSQIVYMEILDSCEEDENINAIFINLLGTFLF